MKNILDLLDKEVAKLPKISKQVHDSQFKALCAKAAKIDDTTKGNQGKKLSKAKEGLRVEAYRLYGRDYEKAGKHCNCNPETFEGWISRNKKLLGILD